MKHFPITLLITIFCLSLCSCTKAKKNSNDHYRLVWEEHFSGKTMDSSSWRVIPRDHSHCFAYMTADPKLYDLRRGRMRLYAKVNDNVCPNDTAQYLTGGISTEHRHSIKFGKIEMRLRMVGAIGTWPAVWLFPVDYKARTNPNPNYAEIDIIEYANRDSFVYQTVHTDYTLSLKQKTFPKQFTTSNIKRDKYNVYAVEILPDGLIFSINGKESFRYPKLAGAPRCQYPFGCELYLMLDMQAVQSGWTRTVDPASFPAYMDIDWVKFYDYIP